MDSKPINMGDVGQPNILVPLFLPSDRNSTNCVDVAK